MSISNHLDINYHFSGSFPALLLFFFNLIQFFQHGYTNGIIQQQNNVLCFISETIPDVFQ